tara:strand:- start:933 stop:1214 length:282 start_codon:yes stop_codon:yes gene_type:complete
MKVWAFPSSHTDLKHGGKMENYNLDNIFDTYDLQKDIAVEVAPTYPFEDLEGDLSKLSREMGRCRVDTPEGSLNYFRERFVQFKKFFNEEEGK